MPRVGLFFVDDSLLYPQMKLFPPTRHCCWLRRTTFHSALQSKPHSKLVFIRFQSSSRRIIDQPSLYLHPTSTKSRYALSLLSTPPVTEDSPTIMGFVNGSDIKPTKFEENPEWREMLHHLLSSICWSDEGLQTQAANREEGYLHIIGAHDLLHEALQANN